MSTQPANMQPANDPIGTANGFKNDIENIGNKASEEIKETIKNAGEAVKDKCKGIKDKLIGFCNFLRHAGVALGTALGVVAGLVAAGVVAITLPVSLPVLGAIAGGLFLGGAIVTLIHNIRDPYIKGAKNVIIQTLKDIGSGMLGAIPTIISFIRDPKQIGKVINFLKTQAEDVRNDVNDLKNIFETTGSKITEEAKGQFNNLLNELNEKCMNYQDKINILTKESIEEGNLDIETLFKDDKKAIQECISGINDFLKGQSLNKDQKKALNALNKSFDVKQLDKSFQKLDESFLENSSKKTDKMSNASSIKIKEAVETNNVPFEVSISKIEKSEEGADVSFDPTEANLLDELKTEGNNNPKRSVIENQNVENKVVSDEKLNAAENAEKETKIENLANNEKISNANTEKQQLGKILKAFKETGLVDLENAVRNKVQSCHDGKENQYNEILKNIETLRVFKAAINDLNSNSRNIGTLNDIKDNALEAIKNLQGDTFVKGQEINFGDLETSIKALKTDSNKQAHQYKMSVEVGSYKSWNPVGWNYEREIKASLQFNENIVPLALA